MQSPVTGLTVSGTVAEIFGGICNCWIDIYDEEGESGELDERKECHCRLELDDCSQAEQNFMRNDMNQVNENSKELSRMLRASYVVQWSWRYCGDITRGGR